MVERRDFGPVAEQMREAIEKYSREELADLLTHIVRVYVIEGKEPSLASTGKVTSPDNLRSLSFSQLVLHLQMNLPHQELKTLRVSGDRVWAARGDQEVLIAGEPLPSSEMPPDWEDLAPREPPKAPRSRGRRAATGPVYNQTEEPPTSPSSGFSRRRRRSDIPTPGFVAQEASKVDRPNIALKDEQPSAPAQEPHERFKEPAFRPLELDDKPEDEVTDLSDRFSMLELD